MASAVTRFPCHNRFWWSPCGHQKLQGKRHVRPSIAIATFEATIDALQSNDQRAIFWDSELPGFGLRIEESGRKPFFVRYRPGGGRMAPKRFLTLGRYGSLTPEETRTAARKVQSAGNLGMDPAAGRLRKRQEFTVSELCDLYLEIGVEHKKTLTVYGDRGRIERHIKPLIGSKRVTEVTLADVERAMKDIADGKTRANFWTGKARARIIIRGGKGAATRVIGLLSGIFSFAQRQGIRTDNPCRGVRRYHERACEARNCAHRCRGDRSKRNSHQHYPHAGDDRRKAE